MGHSTGGVTFRIINLLENGLNVETYTFAKYLNDGSKSTAGTNGLAVKDGYILTNGALGVSVFEL